MASEISIGIWFSRAAAAVREIVDVHGGAVVMTRSELGEAIVQQDNRLDGCPEKVFNHITCSLRRHDLSVCAYLGTDPNILLIFYQTMSETSAREHVESDGLPESVELYMMDSQSLVTTS